MPRLEGGQGEAEHRPQESQAGTPPHTDTGLVREGNLYLLYPSFLPRNPFQERQKEEGSQKQTAPSSCSVSSWESTLSPAQEEGGDKPCIVLKTEVLNAGMRRGQMTQSDRKFSTQPRSH